MTLGRIGDFDGKCPKYRIGEILDGIMVATQNKLRSIFANNDAAMREALESGTDTVTYRRVQGGEGNQSSVLTY